MATALRPRRSPSSMASRCGSQALALGLRCGDATGAEGKAPTSSGCDGSTPVVSSESVITSLAGFEVAFPFVEGFSVGFGVAVTVGNHAMAGFSCSNAADHTLWVST